MQNNINWARWRPTKPSEIIGDEILLGFDAICEETNDEDGERCFLIYGKEGRGKSTIARFVADHFVDHEENIETLKGTKVIQSVVDRIMYDSHMRPMYGSNGCRAVIINEVDNINKDVQDCLHDWLQDELPRNYIVIATTNKKPCSRAQWDKMTKSDRDEHLTPKFGGRFMWFEIPTLSVEEIARELVRMCRIPEQAALVCARNGNGDIRHTLKEVQKALRLFKIKQQRKESNVNI